ncbi:MAG TPA: hypothetical protein VK555_11305 [Terriglobales bacterium]|nr:hypothetical protein [Terriglobales bacterium]
MQAPDVDYATAPRYQKPPPTFITGSLADMYPLSALAALTTD